jgi:hypothetical protein
MIEIRSRLTSVGDRAKWAERGSSFMAKVKATKVVWFPPAPVETAKKGTSSGKKAAKRATKKSTAAAKKPTAAAKKSTKKVTSPVRRKAT